MSETKYGIIKAKPMFPAVDLLIVPHKNRDLIVSYPPFGSSTYESNLKEMQKTYANSDEFPRLTFRPATTSESISAAVFDVAKTKEEILNPSRLQLGPIARTSEGVFANPPKNIEGDYIIDEKALKSYLNVFKKVNGIYLCENDFGFAPYETFTLEEQDYKTFAQGGLARLLEHTKEKTANNFSKIASSEFYKRGIYVFGFDKVEEPVLRVVSLSSDRVLGSNRLSVSGYWYDGSYGCAFGVFDKTGGASFQKI